jgi:transcriptional regulator NrdR family protein
LEDSKKKMDIKEYIQTAQMYFFYKNIEKFHQIIKEISKKAFSNKNIEKHFIK